MYRSAGKPYVAAAKANIWSQSTQEVLDQWDPISPEDEARKARCQEELDSIDQRRGDVEDSDDPRRRRYEAKLMKADKNLIKKLHQTVVFRKTESDRRRRLEKRGLSTIHPDHIMKGNPIPVNGTPPSPDSELESGDPVHSPIFRPSQQRSNFLFNIFRRKSSKQTPLPDTPRPDSFDNAPPREPQAIMDEAYYPQEPKPLERTASRAGQNHIERSSSRTGHNPPERRSSRAAQHNTYPGRDHDRRREIPYYDQHQRQPPAKMSSYEKNPNSSSRNRDRHGEDYRRREKYDDRDRNHSSSHRNDHSRSNDVHHSSSYRRSERDRGGDEDYSRHRSSHRRRATEDSRDQGEGHRRHRSYRDRDRERDMDRERGDRTESSKHRRHRSEGHHKSSSGHDRQREMSRHSVVRDIREEEGGGEGGGGVEEGGGGGGEEEVRREEEVHEEHTADGGGGGDVLSVSDHLHGSLNVGDA